LYANHRVQQVMPGSNRDSKRVPYSTTLPLRDPLLEKARTNLRLARPTPKLLYHYTTVEACFSIINVPVFSRGSPKLWASSALFTNDSTELKHGLEAVRSVAAECLPPGCWVDTSLQHVKVGSQIAIHGVETTCIACFCSVPDLLSQWRAYGKDGAGYAIGFDSDLLAKAGMTMAFDLVPVIYGEEEQRQVLRTFFAEAIKVHESKEETAEYWDALRRQDPRPPPKFDTVPSGPANNTRSSESQEKTVEDLFWAKTLRNAVLLAMSFKNESFREEQEWRLIAPSPVGAEMRYRPGRWGIIPYVEIPLDRRSIVEIWPGPTLDHELTVRTLEMFIARVYGLGPTVERSKIPLRSL
jgi:Protein of unknown function (DUF2971)